MARVAETEAVRARTRPQIAVRRRGFNAGRVVLYAVLILIALFFVIPLLWMISTAFKFESDVFTDKGFIPAEPTLANFQRIMTATGQTPVFRWLLNSLIVSTVGTFLSVTLTSLSAYAFARIDFPGRGPLFALLITTLLLPGVMFLVPQFILVDILGSLNEAILPGVGLIGLNTLTALILPGLAGVFGVFFMRQFFLGIPVELEEAAYVDGASRLRTFLSVVVPLAGPAIATLAVISFLAYWNDYLWPLIVCQGDGCTLPPGLRNFQSSYTAAFGLLMAGATLAAIPVLIVYVAAQRWIVQSVTSAGIKG